MLGLGWSEMLVIGVVALIVIGPKDLPEVMRKVGQFAGMIRRMGSEFQRELNKTTGLDEVRNLRNSITAPLKQTTDDIRREFNIMSSTGPKPSGLIKPTDPKAESIVDEIHAAAGMAPPAVSAQTATVPPKPKAPVKAKRPARLKPVPESTVSAADLTPVDAAVEAPAVPAAPAKKPAPRKTAVKKPAGKATTAKAVAAPADQVAPAKKPAARPKAPAKPKAEKA